MSRPGGMALLQRVARDGGVPAHARLTTERELRHAARILRYLGEYEMAEQLRTMVARLGVQRRRIIKRQLTGRDR